MKRLLLAAAFVCVSFIGVSAAAYADGTTIKNDSGIDIDHFYLSPAGEHAYGPDLMAGTTAGAFDNGKIYTVPPVTDGVYDFRLVDDNGNKDCVMPGIKIRAGKMVTLTKKKGTFCH